MTKAPMTGLVYLPHRELRRVWALYAVLATLLLALPALAVQRRGAASHPTEQASTYHDDPRGPAAHER